MAIGRYNSCCVEGSRAQLAPQMLLPLACPIALVPLPVGHAHESVAQQQMPSLQLLARKCQGPSKSTAHAPLPLLLSPPIPRARWARRSPGRCRAHSALGIALGIMSMEHPDLGQGNSCCCCSRLPSPGRETRHGAPSNAKRHVSFKEFMSLIAFILAQLSSIQARSLA